MITFNLLILSLSLIITGILIYNFILPTKETKKKFRLYKLRDHLAILAMSGKINESQKEYKFLVKNINLAINLYDADFSITNFFKLLIEPQLSGILQIERILEKVYKNDLLRPVFHEYFSIIKLIIDNDIKFFKFIASCIITIFVIYEKVKPTARLFAKYTELINYERDILKPAIIRTAS